MTNLTTSVTRWKHDALGHMTTEPDGEYVAYADYARVLEEVERLERAIETHKNYWRECQEDAKREMKRANTAEADLMRVRGLVGGLPTASGIISAKEYEDGWAVMHHDGKAIWLCGLPKDYAVSLAALLDARRTDEDRKAFFEFVAADPTAGEGEQESK